jgi:sugar phosphate isomerase/epimerase
MIRIATMIGAPDLKSETLAVYSGDLVTGFSKAADLGYDGIELMARDPSKLDGRRIRQLLDVHGIKFVGLCTGHVYGDDGLGLVGPDPHVCSAAMVRVREFIDFAATYCGSGGMVNIGRVRGPGHPRDPARTLDEMAAVFRTLAEYAGSRGVRLVLEPINVHQTPHIHTTQDGVAMVRRVGHPSFGLMLDVYHMNIEDTDIYASFREAQPYLWFVHLADNNRHWPGSAHLNFERIIAALETIAYDGFVSLEILPWPDPETAAKASMETLRRYLKRV